MAEGRKVAEELKKEQSVTAKKMKIGGVETEVTLKSNIGRGVARNSSRPSMNGLTSNNVPNGLPYLPFPISALPEEAVQHIMPVQRGKRQKPTIIKKEEPNDAANFQVDDYKQYNYAKLPEGGLDALKANFLRSFCHVKDNTGPSMPARKLSLKVNEITNTIASRKSSTSSNKSRRSSP